MSKARRDGLYLVLLGSLVFVLMGTALEYTARAPLADFRTVYFPARTLIEQKDPFKEAEVSRVYEAERDSRSPDTAKNHQIATQNVYPPNTLFLVAPFALLPSKPAGTLWLILTFAIVIVASLLVWNLSAEYAPALSGALIGFLLANSELLAITGNVAGMAISLSAVAVWCFWRERFVFLGILCLAGGLVLKPHDTGLVWLYFLLAGGAQRKRAWQTLWATLVLSAPGFLWVWHVAPHWMREWGTNLAAYAAPGGVNDPSLLSSGGHGMDSIISLQSVFSVFRNDPHFYNRAAYLLCAPLLLIWMVLVLRRRSSPRSTWLALAVTAALTMLPVYHRQLDAALLLLAVPGCVLLWHKGGLIARFGLAIMVAALALTGVFCTALIDAFAGATNSQAAHWGAGLSVALQVFPGPLILLTMAVFYLWVYARVANGNSGPPDLVFAADGELRDQRPC
jgi:hypothetical protein